MTGAELDELIEQATVDCYNESEQVTGLFTMIEEYLSLPLQTTVLGMPVTVARVDVTFDDRIVAISARDGHRQTVPILDLPPPTRSRTAGNGLRRTAAGRPDPPTRSHMCTRSCYCSGYGSQPA
jgi:hypothetical protein